MRIALARALLVRPTLLILDEPTNHLDLEACVWLELELRTYPSILLLISHSQDFLNGVCTNIMLLKDRKVREREREKEMPLRTREQHTHVSLTADGVQR